MKSFGSSSFSSRSSGDDNSDRDETSLQHRQFLVPPQHQQPQHPQQPLHHAQPQTPQPSAPPTEPSQNQSPSITSYIPMNRMLSHHLPQTHDNHLTQNPRFPHHQQPFQQQQQQQQQQLQAIPNLNQHPPPPLPPRTMYFPPHPSSERIKIVAGYALQEKLGSGSFAVVYKGVRMVESNVATHPSILTSTIPTIDDADSLLSLLSFNAPVVAIKAISRTGDKLTPKVLSNLEIEISLLRTYRHRNIVCLYHVCKTEGHFYLFLEYCGGGDLQRLIRTRLQGNHKTTTTTATSTNQGALPFLSANNTTSGLNGGRLSEILSRRLLRDLAAGLKFLWQQQVIHRDIKPQNLLLTGCLPIDEIYDPAIPPLEAERQAINFPSHLFFLKIADFGFARHLQTTSMAETLCGSPLYMAPEILQHQRYD
jgi:hypothetical protein